MSVNRLLVRVLLILVYSTHVPRGNVIMGDAANLEGYKPEDGALNQSTDFQWLYDYLITKAGAGRIPGRQHLDPVEMVPILRAVNLVDRVLSVDGMRLRYRLVGSLQAHYFAGGKNVVGHYLDEFWKANPVLKPMILEDYDRAVDRRGPTLGIYERPNEDFPFLGYARMLFPLAGDGSEIDMFIVLHAYRHPSTGEYTSRIKG